MSSILDFFVCCLNFCLLRLISIGDLNIGNELEHGAANLYSTCGCSLFRFKIYCLMSTFYLLCTFLSTLYLLFHCFLFPLVVFCSSHCYRQSFAQSFLSMQFVLFILVCNMSQLNISGLCNVINHRATDTTEPRIFTAPTTI